MASSPDVVWNAGNNDLRLIGETLIRISRTLHEHSRKLEVAVEGKYANEVSDPRVKLLTDSLHTSRIADLELGRLNQGLQRVLSTMQQGTSLENDQDAQSAIFDHEREALTTSITHLKQHSSELETLYDIARTLNSTLEFDNVLRLVMDRVIEFVNAERGFLMLVNPSTGEPEFTIARDKAARTIPKANSPPPRLVVVRSSV